VKQEEIIEVIGNYIDQFIDEEGRIGGIKEIQRVLDFELRWAKLTDEERKEARSVRELGVEMFELLATMTEERREEYLSGVARAEYIKQSAWAGYLSGKSDEKPTIFPAQKAS